MLQKVWLTNCGLVPPRVFLCQHDEVTKPISTVVVSWMKWTRTSSIVLSFHWGHEEPLGVARRAVIVWLENCNERSTFALEFCGGFVAVGTFYTGILDFVREAVPTEVFSLVLSL